MNKTVDLVIAVIFRSSYVQMIIQTFNYETMSYKISSLCLKCSLAVLFLLLLQPLIAQTPSGKPPAVQNNMPAVDELVQQHQAAFTNNLVVIVYKDGKLTYLKEASKEFKKETAIPIGEASKWFTAALVMTFVDEGKLSLDDKVTDYIPIYEKYSKAYITIRDCLAQTTGIEGDVKKMQKLLQKKKFASLEEEVNYFASNNDILNNPGKDFYDGSVGYAIAGRVCEVIAKRKTFDQLIKDRLFKPLMMKKTSFAAETGAINPSSGAVSTAIDYINFLSLFLNKGTVNGKKILSEASIAELLKIRTSPGMIKYAPPGAAGLNYAFGAWASAEDGKGSATSLFAPGENIWPVLDLCRGYAAVVFGQSKQEQKPELFKGFQAAFDEAMPANCK
jgi:CubicO group peptidase (beta-lactamase class C family)